MFVVRKDNSRRFVISDIHGCHKTLEALLEKVNPSREDQLFVLGDYIDRGPASAEVLDCLIRMKAEGYTLYLLKGNHEENLLNAYAEYDKDTFVFFVKKINKSLALLDGQGRIKADYLEFMKGLEMYFETDSHLLVHAGINFSCENPFEDKISMLELRHTDIEKADRFIGSKTIVHGHQVTPLEEILTAVSERKKVIPLDNGCYYTKPHKIYDVTQTGHLCCLDLDTFELILQKNVDG